MDPLRIAVLAPPWIPVPAPAYGGIEEVVRLLCEELVGRGHDVTLFAPPRSRSPADVVPMLDEAHPDEIERSVWEVDHVARAFDAIDGSARPYAVVHDHTGFTALAMANRLGTPLVHTLHAPFDETNNSFYAAHAHKGTVVAISHSQLESAPRALAGAPVVHNPLRFEDWERGDAPRDHVLWVGRMAAVKGPHRAIAAARRAGVPLVLAGPVQRGQETLFSTEVEPHLDGGHVRYVGEVGGADKAQLYRSARAVLMPIRWDEPFGLVMVESLACGTPVIAFREGAAREIVVDGECGFLVDDEDEMADAIGRIDQVDRARCRASAEERFGLRRCVDGYEAAYERAMAGGRAISPARPTRAA